MNLISPLRNAILLYVVLFILLFMFKPDLIFHRDLKSGELSKKIKCTYPILVILISILSYYIFVLMKCVFERFS
jgi:hypothetical protein